MVCPSFVLGGDANTSSAGYVCLETEFMEGVSDFHAAMPAAFAFAAFFGLAVVFRSGLPVLPRRFSWVESLISMPRCLLRSPLPR